MNIVEVYARADGTIAHIFTPAINGGIEVGALMVARFDAIEHLQRYIAINTHQQYIHFIDGDLVLDTHPVLAVQVVADETWILARKAEVEAFENRQIDDITSKNDILDQAQATLDQIEADRTVIAASNIPAPVKTVFDNTLIRQRRIVKAIRSILRNGL